MNIAFTSEARTDLDRIFAWIAQDNLRAAYRMVARLEKKISRLGTPGLSYMGRPGLVLGTYELVDRPYIVVYKVNEERQEILVLSVVHGARNRQA